MDSSPSVSATIEPKNQPIISVSGLRGVIPEQLSPWVVTRYVAAVAEHLAGKKVVIGRDGRESGPMFSQVVSAALRASGCYVLDADVAATPTIGILVRELGAAAGIQISASHNPVEYNGIKVFNEEGRVVPADQGAQYRQAYLEGRANWQPVSSIGDYSRIPDPHLGHLQKVVGLVDQAKVASRRLRVLLDSNHGAGCLLGKRLLESLGCDVTLCDESPDGKFAHSPEPIAENLTSIGKRVLEGKFDVAFCQDPDADRVAIIDDQGSYIGEEYTVALCLMNVLRKRSGPVIVNCATSWMNRAIAEKYGCDFYQSAVGEANVVDMMKSTKAVMGGEGNGGPIDPNIGWVRDSFVGMGLVLELMADTGKSIRQLVAEIPATAMIKGKMAMTAEALTANLGKLKAALQADRVSTLDGVRLEWADRWLLLRASNTEPIVRLIAEAPDQKTAAALISQAQAIMAG